MSQKGLERSGKKGFAVFIARLGLSERSRSLVMTPATVSAAAASFCGGMNMMLGSQTTCEPLRENFATSQTRVMLFEKEALAALLGKTRALPLFCSKLSVKSYYEHQVISKSTCFATMQYSNTAVSFQ